MPCLSREPTLVRSRSDARRDREYAIADLETGSAQLLSINVPQSSDTSDRNWQSTIEIARWSARQFPAVPPEWIIPYYAQGKRKKACQGSQTRLIVSGSPA